MTCLIISDNCCQLILYNTDLHTIASRSKCQNCQCIKTSISPSVNSFLGGIISLTFLWKRWHLKQPVINLQFSCIFCTMFWKPTVKLFSFFFEYPGKPFLTLSLSLWLYVEIYVYRRDCTWRKNCWNLDPCHRLCNVHSWDFHFFYSRILFEQARGYKLVFTDRSIIKLA